MNEKIIVKTNPGNILANGSVILIWLLLTYLCFKKFEGQWQLSSIMSGIAFVALIPGWIGGGRKFVMDKEGCTIHFLWFKRQYRWDELQTKRYATYKKTMFTSGRAFVGSGAEFSINKIDEFRRTDAAMYARWHPLTFFYVCFENDKVSKHDATYLVKESDFRSLMQEWGVVLDEYTVQ